MATKMTYAELMNRQQILSAISNKVLPRKASVAIARNITRFEKEVKVYDDQRLDIVKRYASKDENGEYVIENNSYIFTEENEKLFEEEFKQLNKTEIEVDLVTFDAVDLELCEQRDRYDILTPREEAALSWMIKYE